ncbi:MAG TPA: MerR family transcriptional regulator, partial [Actinomycetota bacterium]
MTPTKNEWTIDELARKAGTTTRNIRSYQTKGILPPPRMVGRVGYYSEGHLARLKYTAGLQQRGFSLAAIGCLLSAWEEGRSLQDVLGFEEAG